MAKSESSELSCDLLMCKICQLPYNEPKRLPCLHTFCKACLIYHAKVNAVSTHDDASLCLFCPLCRQLCELPIRNGIESLPDHHLLKSLIETVESRTPRYCDVCAASVAMTSPHELQQQQKKKDKKWTKHGHRASHCCVKCEEFLCNSCARSHRQQRTTADHLVVSVGAMKELCQVMTIEQLQKPNVAAKLITKFALTPPVGDRAGSRMPAARRSRLSGGSSSVSATLEPRGLTVTKAGELVVANSRDDSVLMYDSEGRLTRRIDQRQLLHTTVQQDDDNDRDDGAAAAAAADVDKPDNKLACIAVTAEGYIAVAIHDDAKTGSSNGARSAMRRVAVVESLAGRVVSQCEIKPASRGEVPPWPYGIVTTENGHVVVSDAANHCVYVFDADYRLARRFGRRGSRNRQFKSPRHLAITPDNDLLVSDYGNHCIKVFSLGGDFRLKIGAVGSDPGRFIHPAGLCTDKFGNVFVADRDNHRVQMFDKSGKHIAAVLHDTCSASAGRDVRPVDVAVTSQSRLAVLLTGVEGVDFAEVHIYQLRCTLPPPEVRSVEQILSTIRALRRSDPTPLGSASGDDDDDDNDDDCHGSKKVRFKLPESRQQRRRASSADATPTSAELNDHDAKSQVCVII